MLSQLKGDMNTTVTRTEKLQEVTAVYVEEVDSLLDNPAGLHVGSCLTSGSAEQDTDASPKHCWVHNFS